jgi:beta-glucosidase
VGSDYKQEGENLATFSKSDKTTEKAMGGDRYSLRIPEEEVELIHRACREFDKVIVNIIGGSAYIIEEWKEEAACILHSFYSGMEGGNALAEILSGKVNPSGHLPFTIAKSEDDYPDFLFPGSKTRDIVYGYHHGYTLLDRDGKKAAYPFGFGLSYTEFKYSDISCSHSGNAYLVSLKVANTGNADGKTVVQVYAGAEGEQALKLLKGYKKIFLQKGESRDITIEIPEKDLKFYNPDNGEWYLASGYTFYVGQDSEDAMKGEIRP